ncbi:MAG: sigma-54 dependent transcriptional regulator, partial [bacterium]
IVDDEESSLELCKIALQALSDNIVLCSNAQEAMAEIRKNPFDVVITDMVMPGSSGLDLLKFVKSERSEIPVLLMSGRGTISAAVEAMKMGSEDFIEKPLYDPEVLLISVQRILKAKRLEQENCALRRELQKYKPRHCLIGGETMSQVMRTIEMVALLDTTVLITGETGVGKEVMARRIHTLSPRSDQPFVALNCGGLPEGIVESLLFGHERGAFTGAIKRTIGYFEAAHGGSLFFDEIGDMSLSLQVKLLRVLQERTFRRVGGDTVLEMDCRIIAATHHDLLARVKDGLFRDDLYYRLNVVPIHIPPLRDRKEDIPALVQHFIRLACAKQDKSVHEMSVDALNKLVEHHWPGNIRELENVIERAVALTSVEEIKADSFPDEIAQVSNKQKIQLSIGTSYHNAKLDFEKQFIVAALEVNRGNVSAAARKCGIPRQNFYQKMKKLGIKS